MTDTTAQFKKQLPRNMFLQVLSFTLQIGIGIWLVPYLVQHLGRAAYGLIPIAGVMTQYVSLVSYSISGAVTRFLTIALQQNDDEEANRIFNTAFFSYLALGLLQIPLFGLIIYCANTIFSIPEELYRDAIVLLMCSAASFLISLACSVFNVPMYANNRLDISRAIDIVRLIGRLAGIIILFGLFGPALRYVGYVDLSLTILLCATYVVIARRLAPVLKLNVRSYDWSKVRQLTGMGGWLVVNQLGALLFLRIDVWVCNRFVSPEAAGDYAAILQWSNLIRQAGTLLAAVTAPMILIYYARGEVERLIRLSTLSVRVLSLLLAIPISLLCIFSQPLLSLWLGESFAGLWPLMVIMVSHLAINVGVMPLFSIQIAVNKVRWPGIVTLIMGTGNLTLAIFLAKYAGWGIYGVATAGAIVLTAKNALFTPIYGALILRQRWYALLRSYVIGLAFLGGLLIIGGILGSRIRPASWLPLAVMSLAIGLVGLVVLWFVLSKRDRQLMIDMLPSQFRHWMARVMPI
jgi:O-antigen/teichoic acid export membrane protein